MEALREITVWTGVDYRTKGSKGNSYFVNVEEKTCTCPGFTFRGNCKHVEAL